jgi:hypothetical protein
VQFERGTPPFVVLSGDKLAVEPKVLRARGLERSGQRVEMISNRR